MRNASSDEPGFRRALTFFDVTNITVGAIVGADIYVASTLTAGLLGPASLLAWAAAGVLATLLALTLAECARLVPAVGGPYAYASNAFGRLPGFLAGWSMWIAELSALPVFAIAFTNYLGFLLPLNDVVTHSLRILFLVTLTTVNVASVRAAGRLNDALTVLKLAPLLTLVVGGSVYAVLHGAEVGQRLSPFAPFGFTAFPSALVLIIWAYMGFELSTVPSGEVTDPAHTIPRALTAGMATVTVFYLTTNAVVYALIGYADLAQSRTPLVNAATVVFGSVGALGMAVGATLSVSGSDESDMLGSSRLAYAMAADGLLPRSLARLHPRFRTPHVALIAQSSIAIALTFIDQLGRIISFAVVNLSVAFLLCGLAAIHLHHRDHLPVSLRQRVIPYLGVAVASGLLLATSQADKVAGAAVLAIGVVVYLYGARGEGVPEAKALLLDVEHTRHRLARRGGRFLGALFAWSGRRQRADRH